MQQAFRLFRSLSCSIAQESIRRSIPLVLSGGLLIASTNAVLAEPTDFSPVKLRGYGTLGGTLTPVAIDGAQASTLKIVCDDAGKAKLVQAKFLSDLQTLPGVKPVPLAIQGQNGPVTAYEAEDQGVLLAARDGATVHLFSAPSAKALIKLVDDDSGTTHAARVYAPEVKVPMSLERFDQY